ncbi:DUF1493 family protein [Enterobacter hormaechei]|uniref:DUF1493 family protein n=1 Tax=Enterobacter hormaechei TaxID=158836 RepID=UPI00079AA04C|nr:DUF1493 family protein [Enterobacter hormaechei]MCU3016991.1 DUF1493 family protein [Enterobacter hormaechei subsp. oharae]MCU3612890.1 DUF1493 family protein [Enterobacter hormaechei subsp. oharae]MCW8152208.1 DUF1493 family protein [Enterobacter hormaechei]CZV03026.1 Protein of uncharacterised function (DUF1493) [Enterobacter hormaechei]CZV09819.1 Protein of uncharacterised function (DUF1493) [Enterobacter hormaechei]
MNSENDVLMFFRENLPEQGTFTGKRIPLEIDDILQDYTDLDDIVYAIEKYEKKYLISVPMQNYFPWTQTWFFRKWFTQEPLKQISKPLTVRMFAEAVKAGTWIHN